MMGRLDSFSLPPEWGEDELSFLMEQAHRNRVATFKNKSEFQRLIKINDCFQRASENWINPQNQVAALLLIRSHSAFFSACEKAASSALADTFPHIRACIEYAAYALHIHETEGLAEIWLKRHDGRQDLAAVRREFSLTKLLESIRRRDRHTADAFHRIYEESIDYGAHPNERSVTGSLEIDHTESGREYRQLWFHGDGPKLDYALVSTARSGICALQILQNVFGARFELLGINADLLELRAGI